jgi:UDP-N-acetylmuramoyl-tripeptide--D-alanyl-D-alanine ligase
MTSTATPIATSVRATAFILDRAAAIRLTGGAWHGPGREIEVHGATLDSRAVTPGCLFACLAGARADGHDYAATAVGDGAALVLASRPVDVPVPVLVVADVAVALGRLAAEFRRRHPDPTWIGITGSNGKTTVKELLAAACGGSSLGVHATRVNLNNHLGVPVTVLNMPERTAYAVIEMGANHPGEIADLVRIVQPHLGVISAIGPAHLEGFGSLMGVARAKGELFVALPAGAPALVGLYGLAEAAAACGEDVAAVQAELAARSAGRRLMLVGSRELPVTGAVREDGVVLDTPAGQVRLGLLGAHNLANAALAYHAACAAGIPPERALKGLAATKAVTGRLCLRRTGAHVLLDDSYNANPASMVAGLAVLALQPGRRLAVLGGMGELGASSAAGHRQVGAEAARLGLALLTVGGPALAIADAYRAAGGADGEHVDSREAAVAAVRRRLAQGPTAVLVKASHAVGLEAVVKDLIAGAAPC